MSDASRRTSPTPAVRARLGLALGLFVAGSFSLLAAGIWLWNGRSLDYLNVTLGQLVLTYLAWGAPVGLVTGLLLPITRTGVGAAIMGGFIMASAYLLTGLMMASPLLELGMGIGLGLAVGGVFGYKLFPRYWSWIGNQREGRDV